MLFKKATFFYFFLISFIGSWLVFSHVRIRPEDRKLYAKLVEETSILRNTTALERHPSQQKRDEAQKDLWTFNGTERVHFRMHSDHSKLFVQQKKDKVEALEEMEAITCFSPLSGESNLVKLIAKNGFYEYPSQNLVANQVECFHELGYLQAQKATLAKPENNQDPLLFLENGVHFEKREETQVLSILSQEAKCDLAFQKILSFNKEQKIEFIHQVAIEFGEGISAFGGLAIYREKGLVLYPESSKSHCILTQKERALYAEKMDFDLARKSVQCENIKTTIATMQEPSLEIAAGTLFWEKGNEKIELKTEVSIQQDNRFSILSDRADLFLKTQDTLQRIEMKENVRLFSNQMQNKDSFAIADSIEFFPEEEKMILSSSHPKKVLFWQEGASLSASEIHIQKDPMTKEPFVQGKGDIHFTFTTEEQNIINQFISKYL